MTTHLSVNLMDIIITVLMKTPIYMGSLIMKDKEKKKTFRVLSWFFHILSWFFHIPSSFLHSL